MSNYNKYIGARYVPLFSGAWDNSLSYEPLCIVTNLGNSYTSKTFVPIGVDILDTKYWVATGNFNAQLEAYRQEVINMQDEVNLKQNITDPTLQTIAKKIPDAINENLALIKNLEKNLLNILDIGGKANDETFDNTPIINSAITTLENMGGGILYLPVGVYYCNPTINLKPNVKLLGAITSKRDDPTKGSVIKTKSISTDPLIFGNGSAYTEFLYNSQIENLTITGVLNYTTAIKLSKCSYTKLKNVNILYVKNGLVVSGGMLDSYTELNITLFTGIGLLYNNDITSTTQRYNNLYIGQSKAYPNAIPLKMNSYSSTDTEFIGLTLESNPNGCEIGTAISVFITNLYTENMPTSGVGQVFYLGKKESTDDPSKINFGGYFNVKDGYVLGLSTGYENISLFNFDFIAEVLITNVYYRKYGFLYSKTINSLVTPTLINTRAEIGLITTDISRTTVANMINCKNSAGLMINKILPMPYTVPLQNSWVNLGSGYSTFKVQRNSDNTVTIEGTLTGGQSGIIATLPIELRPTGILTIPACAVISSTWTPSVLLVKTNGEIESKAGTVNVSFAFTYTL